MSLPMHRESNGRILVKAPLGTSITLADGGFRTLAETVTELDRSCPDGTYSLRLSAGERSRQWVVRIHAGKTWRFPEDLPPLPAGGKDDGSLADPRQACAAQMLERFGLSKAGEVAIVVIANDFEPEADLSRFVRLRKEGSGDIEPVDAQVESNGWLLLRFEAGPGAHLLNIETSERKRVEQPIMVFERLRTVVLMEYGQASIIERRQDTKHVRKRRGIDPARTIIVTQGRDIDTRQLADRFRLAEILLYLLRTRIRPVDASVAAALHSPRTDPMLKLYAAAGSIALPGSILQRLATSIADKHPEFLDRAEAVAGDLYHDLEDHHRWPDVTCLGWRLRKAHDAAMLASLPMLEVSWRWAAAHSVRERIAQVVIPSAPGANRRTEANASPWLTISPSAAPQPSLEGSDLLRIAPELTAMAKNLAHALLAGKDRNRTRAPGNEEAGSLDLSDLSPTTERIVLAIVNAGGAERWGRSDEGLLPQLAASLGEPLGTLAATIQAAAVEVEALVSRAVADPQNVLNSDPHKGRFGGAPSCRGARIELDTVTKSDYIDTYTLEIVVSTEPGAEPLKGPVTFYLHPTFSPSVITERPIRGRVVLSLHAWGAFTLGAKTEDGRIMELDLSQELILPQEFRDR